MRDFRRVMQKSHVLVWLVSAAPLLLCAEAPQKAPPVKSKPAADAAQAQVNWNFGKTPMSFEENRGQADRQVKFLSEGQGYSLFLTSSGVTLNLQTPSVPSKPGRHALIQMGFSGAKSATVTGEEQQKARTSYFVGNDPAKWVAGVPNFARVRYGELYPGIDLAFYGNQGQLEYDFVVAPGADPRAIRLAFDGVDGLRVDEAGDLVLRTAAGEVRQHKPIVYQEDGATRHTIAGRYVLQSHNRVAFEVGAYDARKPLIIDPVLSFATYLGSPGDEIYAISAAASQASYPAIAVDTQGNVYVTGYNGGSASDFTGTPVPLNGSPQNAHVFVLKLSPSGSLIYAVLFGGSGTDIGGGIAVDTAGNAYVTGSTTSQDFPITANAPQSGFYGNSSSPNAFATEVNAAGNALVYSTYLGGSGSFLGRGIAVDRSGNAYVTGTAQAASGTSFPLINEISNTPSAGFLSEINAGGTSGFAYSTYLPAGIGYAVAVDTLGDAFVTGSTGTQSAPSPAQAYVLKVNAGGASLGYAGAPIYLGTAGLQTAGFGIALDATNDAYVTGMTSDPNFPQIYPKPGAAQSTYGGGLYDGFVVKLNPSGGLIYGTYIGGLGSSFLPERGSAIGVDLAENAYVSGTTQCIGFPVTNQISGARNGGPAVLMETTNSGSNWYNTTLAGSFDQVSALAFDANSNFYAGASALNATGGGVYKLANGSSTWMNASSGITSTTIEAIAADPNTPTTVYAIGSGNLYQTTNGGASWTLIPNTWAGTVAVMAIAKTSPSTVYLGTNVGVIYSTSPGTWSSPTLPPGGGSVYALAADPNNPMTAYASTPSGIYKTINGGSVWTAVNNGLPPVPATSLAINGATSTIYAATPNGLYYSTNAGANWTQVDLGVQNPSTPYLVAVDAGNNVYVAFDGSGIAVGTNGGTGVWSTAATYNGLTQNQTLALAVPPGSSGTAYAGIVAATTAFLTEISPNGESFSSSTCIGGSDNNLGQGIAVTPGGSVYVSGATYATNFPTANAVQAVNAGSYDAFAAGINTLVSNGEPSGPPSVNIDVPAPGAIVSGVVSMAGWAIDNTSVVGTAISSVQVFVDGVMVGTATYGVNRADVCAVYPGRVGCPNVGYTFSLDTTALSAGTHKITVYAADSDVPSPDIGSASVTVTVSSGAPSGPPSVNIDSPTPNETISGTFSVVGWAIDNTSAIGSAINPASLQVKVDGVLVGTATYGTSRADVCDAYPARIGCPNVGFTYSLNTAELTPGTHTITVYAADSDVPSPGVGSASVTVAVSTGAPSGPPSVNIDTPTPNQSVSGTVSVTGWAIDNTSAIGTAINPASVQVQVDGVLVGTATYGVNRGDVCAAYPGRAGCPNVGFTYQLDTAAFSVGTHTITVYASDSDVPSPGVGSASVTVTVSGGAPPSVNIDDPAPNAAVSGTILVTGWAIDNTSAIGTAINPNSLQVKVDGYVYGIATYGGDRADVCAAYPGRAGCPNVGFNFELNTAPLSPGAHTITVSATDSDDPTPDTGSASVTISVGGAVRPSVNIDAPAPNAVVSGTLSMTGWAIDNTTAIGTAINPASLEVFVDGVLVGAATYGVNRQDVCNAYPGRPGCPNVGFNFTLDTLTLTNGPHTITVWATDTDSSPDTGSASVNVTVLNGGPSVNIDTPVAGASVSGTITVSGWAIDNVTAIGTAINPNSLQVTVDGVLMGTATYGVNRPDVCAAYPGRPGCPNVGFTFELNTSGLAPGAHTLTVFATDTDPIPDTGSASVTINIT
jgi:hypothetical protein